MKIQELIDWVKPKLPVPMQANHMQPGIDDPGTAGAYAMFTRIAAGTLSTEDLFNGVGVTIETVGEQYDYSGAEDFALAMDKAMLSASYSQLIGTSWVLSVSRVGAGPAELEYDDANRYHFVCDYLIDVESGLAP